MNLKEIFSDLKIFLIDVVGSTANIAKTFILVATFKILAKWSFAFSTEPMDLNFAISCETFMSRCLSMKTTVILRAHSILDRKWKPFPFFRLNIKTFWTNKYALSTKPWRKRQFVQTSKVTNNNVFQKLQKNIFIPLSDLGVL